MVGKELAGKSLSSRLRYLREAQKGLSAGTRKKRTDGLEKVPLPDTFVGWRREGPFLYSRVYETVSPLLSENVYLPAVSLFLKNRSVEVKNLLFYDLETTGLSTGAGVIAFLAGFGKIIGDTLIIKQFFLADFPGELEFIQLLLGEINAATVLVSYNGRTFDHNLLITRALMNGLKFPETAEIDLLHGARRLWKNHLPDCSLSTVENLVLGIQRSGDVPGRDIPDIYFSFLKNKNISVLKKVFSHHQQDITSLVFLISRMKDLYEHPEECRKNDCYSLGKYLLSEKKREGLELLRKVWAEKGAFSYSAGILVSLYYKRLGNRKEAVSLWKEMWEREQGFFEGVELAKFYEHKKKNYKKAEYYTKNLLFLENDKSRREQLLYRLQRLKRKLGLKNPFTQ